MSLRDGLTGFSNFLFPVLVGAPKGISFGHKPRPYLLRDAYRGTRAGTQAVPPPTTMEIATPVCELAHNNT